MKMYPDFLQIYPLLMINGYECDRRGRFSAATESTRELEHPFSSNVYIWASPWTAPN